MTFFFVDSKNKEFLCITLNIFSKNFERVSSSKNCKSRLEYTKSKC